MNCLKCNNYLSDDAKFCSKCGNTVIGFKGSNAQNNISKKDKAIEKLEKSIKNTGSSLFALGIITIILNVFLLVWGLVDKNYSEMGLPKTNFIGVLIIGTINFIFIILGNRIKKLNDKNTKKYLQIALILSVLTLIFVLATGGQIGFLFILLIAYLFSSLHSINKLMECEIFTAKLSSPKYSLKLDKKGWIFFSVIIGALLISAIFTDTYFKNKNNDKISKEAINKVSNYFSDNSEWKEFNSTTGQFKATFPTYPTHETENQEITDNVVLKMDSYTSVVADNTSYAINFATYPLGIDVSDAETSLEGGINGIVAAYTGNKLIFSDFTVFSGHKAINYLIENKNEGIFLKGKNILAGQTLYQLMVAYPNGSYNDADYNKFINSFQLLK